VQLRTGRSVSGAFDAIRSFNRLSSEEQMLFTTTVLTADLRDAGRTASALTGAARDAAYARGYAALDSMFPASDRIGSVRMGSSTGEMATTPATLAGSAGSAAARNRKLPPSENPARYSGAAPDCTAIARSAPVTPPNRQE